MAIYLIEKQQKSDDVLKNLLIQLLRHRNETLIQYNQESTTLNFIHRTAELNLYFISILIDEPTNHVSKLIETIQKSDTNSQIVLVTDTELYEQNLKAKWSAIVILNKNDYFMHFAENVENQVNYYFQQKQQGNHQTIIIKDRTRMMKIPLNRLRYVESNGMHKIRFVGKNLQYEFYLPLNQIEPLHEDLLRIHRSFIVNKMAVKDVSRGKRIVQLKDNTLLPLSRTYFNRVIHDLEQVCK